METLTELPQISLWAVDPAGRPPEHRAGEAGEPSPVTEGGRRDSSQNAQSHPQDSPEPDRLEPGEVREDDIAFMVAPQVEQVAGQAAHR